MIDAVLEDVPGIGELYICDTSLRISAKLDLFPKGVYLHADTRLGAHEIEDALCIFKDELVTFPVTAITQDIASRSRCGQPR